MRFFLVLLNLFLGALEPIAKHRLRVFSGPDSDLDNATVVLRFVVSDREIARLSSQPVVRVAESILQAFAVKEINHVPH